MIGEAGTFVVELVEFVVVSSEVDVLTSEIVSFGEVVSKVVGLVLILRESVDDMRRRKTLKTTIYLYRSTG